VLAASDSPAPRVVVVSNVSKWGGGGVVGFRDMLLGIRKRRPDVDLVAVIPQKGDVAQRCVEDGIDTKIAWTPWWGFGKWSRFRIDPHVLIGWLPYTVILLPGVVQALLFFRRRRPTMVVTNTMTVPSHAVAAKILGIPHHWMVREFGRDDHGLWFLFGYRRTVRMVGWLSESVICNSHAVERAMLALDPTMKTHVLYPVVDTELGVPPQRQPGERLRTVLVGYFSEAKGQNLAIEAIAIARKSGVEIELTLIGTGSHQPLHSLAQRLGVADLLTIHEPTRDLRPHWAAAHVGLMCSQSEAFGRVTVEAMRAGLPVCGTNSGGTPEIIEPGVAGLLSPAGDAAALAANLMTLEADEELRRRLALSALESSQRFQRDRHDDELATFLGLR
jgi:glycosyltransferase involved in cell wall biosynthesis